MSIQKIYLKGFNTLSLGDRLICNRKRAGIPMKIGIICKVVAFEEYENDEGDEEIEVCLQSSVPFADWNDGGGITPPNCGWWFTTRDISACFTRIGANIGKDLCIKKDFLYNNINLKDKKCKVLTSGAEGILLEFEENIGGSSGDGLGRCGHCLLVEEQLLMDDKIEAAERKSNQVPNNGLIEAV